MPKRKEDMKSEIDLMLEKIRKAIGECNSPERECYEALVVESEGWQMRLEELDEEEFGDDKE